MRASRALSQYSKLYDALFGGIDAGKADEALERFMAALAERCDRPSAHAPITHWDDVESRFPNILYAQPECLAATILWDQVWAARAGVGEVRSWIAGARDIGRAQQWPELKEVTARIIGHSLFVYLPRVVQAEIFQLGCKAAFLAEDWDQYALWASTLEDEYQTKEVLHSVVTDFPLAKQKGRKS